MTHAMFRRCVPDNRRGRASGLALAVLTASLCASTALGAEATSSQAADAASDAASMAPTAMTPPVSPPPVASSPAAPVPASIAAAVADPRRSAANVTRDVYRHPLQTLTFFEVTPATKVVEIYPSGGWYTEILAPLLKARGIYYAAVPWVDPGAAPARGEGLKRYQALLATDPARFDAVRLTALAPPDHTAIAPPGTADLVLTFRNVHNWLANGTADGMFAAFFVALRPGGLLGVVEHRAAQGTSMAQMKTSGYVTEEEVISRATKAGFELAGRSETNANPRDTKDYPKGVWTLPPSLTLGAQDLARYQAIGESDRMTLKFKKPGSSP